MLDDRFFNLFDESLKIISCCPICNSRYSSIEAKILAEKNDAHLVYIKCRNCQTAILAVILANNLGVSSVGLVTDLNSDDILKFEKSKPISCDDVIEMHQSLIKDKVLIDQLSNNL